MKEVDEPIISGSGDSNQNESSSYKLIERIRNLINAQSYAVLCTQTEAQPYGSLVAFATSDTLRQVVIATPVTTRKYDFMKKCPNVAMVIDSRQGPCTALMELEAVTATGVATEITIGKKREEWGRLLVKRHQYLHDFIAAESCALFVIEVERYLHVTRFQEVSQWIPKEA
jgi:nitroimidazol reductase NimA-like FMN-containing flavoprotein (pyridoxamine 5'-phosphate oxidase superfamily)